MTKAQEQTSLDDLFAPSTLPQSTQPYKSAADARRAVIEKNNAENEKKAAEADQDTNAQPELMRIQQLSTGAIFRTSTSISDMLMFDRDEMMTARQFALLGIINNQICDELHADSCDSDNIRDERPELTKQAQEVMDTANALADTQLEAAATMKLPGQNLTSQMARAMMDEINQAANETHNESIADGSVSLPQTIILIKAVQALESYKFFAAQFRHKDTQDLILLEPEEKDKKAVPRVTDDALPAYALPEMDNLQKQIHESMSLTADKAISAMRSLNVQDMNSDQALDLTALNKVLCAQSKKGECADYLAQSRAHKNAIINDTEDPGDLATADTISHAPIDATKSAILWLSRLIDDTRSEDTESFLKMTTEGKVSQGLIIKMMNDIERQTRFINSVNDILHPAAQPDAPETPAQSASPVLQSFTSPARLTSQKLSMNG